MINKGLFTSKTYHWETPRDLFANLDNLFHFDLDPCALPSTAKCRRYITPDEDGLKQPWEGSVFMNPPYGREIGKWVQKAYTEAQKDGTTIVCLLPARTDTVWWQDYCTKGHVWLIRGRLKFGDSHNSAPFPSAIVIFSRLLSIIRTAPPCVTRETIANGPKGKRSRN